ncbi:MAG: hypothetical protein AB9897_04600 [Anaerolineaceae bacterium]
MPGSTVSALVTARSVSRTAVTESAFGVSGKLSEEALPEEALPEESPPEAGGLSFEVTPLVFEGLQAASAKITARVLIIIFRIRMWAMSFSPVVDSNYWF